MAPNAWELERLAGRPVTDPDSAGAAGRALGKPTLVSSVQAGGEIGVAYVDAETTWLARHALASIAPKGTGDLLTAVYVAGVVGGLSPREALSTATGAAAEAAFAADGAGELPLSAFPIELRASPRVTLERVGG